PRRRQLSAPFPSRRGGSPARHGISVAVEETAAGRRERFPERVGGASRSAQCHRPPAGRGTAGRFSTYRNVSNSLHRARESAAQARRTAGSSLICTRPGPASGYGTHRTQSSATVVSCTISAHSGLPLLADRTRSPIEANRPVLNSLTRQAENRS